MQICLLQNKALILLETYLIFGPLPNETLRKISEAHSAECKNAYNIHKPANDSLLQSDSKCHTMYAELGCLTSKAQNVSVINNDAAGTHDIIWKLYPNTGFCIFKFVTV